jgi:hypothetical protein
MLAACKRRGSILVVPAQWPEMGQIRPIADVCASGEVARIVLKNYVLHRLGVTDSLWLLGARGEVG